MMYEMMTWKLRMTIVLAGVIQHTAFVIRTLPTIPRTAWKRICIDFNLNQISHLLDAQ